MNDVLQSLSQVFSAFGQSLEKSIYRAELRVMKAIRRIQRLITISIFEVFFLFLGVLAIGFGAVLFLLRFFPKDAVLVSLGVILLNIALILHLVKRSIR